MALQRARLQSYRIINVAGSHRSAKRCSKIIPLDCSFDDFLESQKSRLDSGLFDPVAEGDQQDESIQIHVRGVGLQPVQRSAKHQASSLCSEIAANPLARPPSKSRSLSRPMESRSRPSLIPAARRAPTLMLEWVMVTGWAIRLSTQPRDSAKVKTFTASTKLFTAVFPPLSSKLSIAPNPYCCATAIPCPGWDARPG